MYNWLNDALNLCQKIPTPVIDERRPLLWKRLRVQPWAQAGLAHLLLVEEINHVDSLGFIQWSSQLKRW